MKRRKVYCDEQWKDGGRGREWESERAHLLCDVFLFSSRLSLHVFQGFLRRVTTIKINGMS